MFTSRATPLVAGAIATVGTFVIARAIEGTLVRSAVAGAAMGVAAATIAALALVFAKRRGRVETLAVAAGIGAAVVFAAILVLVISVMFFSH